MTIHKLIAVGVDLPERLLFMSAEEIGRLRGIEPVMGRRVAGNPGSKDRVAKPGRTAVRPKMEPRACHH
jgi:hypothetical protein